MKEVKAIPVTAKFLIGVQVPLGVCTELLKSI